MAPKRSMERGSQAPSFEFITLTSRPESQKNDFSFKVRSHAMQSFLHQKNNPNSIELEPARVAEASVESKTPRQLSGKFKLATWSRKPRRKAVEKSYQKDNFEEELDFERARDKFLVSGQTQPSQSLQPYGNALPIILQSPSTRKLLYHCKSHTFQGIPVPWALLDLTSLQDSTSFRANAFAMNFNNAWKSFSITDSVLLHATMSLTAQHQDLLRGGVEDSREGLWHKGKVMRLMKARLREKGRVVSDSDITSVALLVIIESINGPFEASSAHRIGLMKMIDLRGGYRSFEQNAVVLRVLAWSDIVYSTRFGSPPIFPCLFPSSDPFSGPLFQLTHHHPDFLTLTSEIFDDPESSSLLQTLRNMNYAVDLQNLTLPEKKAIVDALYNTETILLSSEHHAVPFSFSKNGQGAKTTTLSRAFHLCTLLYLHLTIRLLPAQCSPLHSRLLSKLLILLSSIPAHELQPPHALDILLWCVFVGTATARDRGTRIELIMFMWGIEPGLEWVGREGARERLRRVVWREDVCDGALERIWGRILRREGMEES